MSSHFRTGVSAMNVLLLALLGGVAGAALFSGPLDGFAFGAVIGALAAWLLDLRRRVTDLERRVQRTAPAGEWSAPGAAAAPAEDRPARPAAPPPAPAAGREREWTMPSVPEPRPSGPAPRPATALGPSALDRLLARAKAWLTTGNVPVKAGVILSVFGAAFLVKEAIDRNWMVVPIEVRLIAVALFGIALCAVGWRLRATHRSYALSVQGGGVALLYLTIYASFALYGLLPAAAAFALLVLLTAASGVLAVLQDARSLAVLGIVGGFMAPVLVSAGTGDHVALFGYYAVLDLAIFGIAWFKAWRALNLLGFLFTFGIGSLWGYQGYRPELFASTEPFLILFVLLYTLIPVLFALRGTPNLRGFVDGTLVFGTPIVGFALQTRLLGDNELGLAASALALAALYVALGIYLYRRADAALRVLSEALLGLCVVFLTLAVPLALDARWTSAAWGLQGAALVWLSVRQQRPLALAAGALLQLAAGGSYLAHYVYDGAAVANGAALGAALMALAGAFSAWWLDHAPNDARHRRGAAPAFLAWATLWWLGAGAVQIERLFAAGALEAFFVFVAATVVAVAFAAPRLDWRRLAHVGVLGTVLIGFGALSASLWQRHPFEDWGALAWPVLFGAHYVFLRVREADVPQWRAGAHAAAYWAAAGLLAWEAHWQVDRVTGGAWPGAAALAVAAAVLLATLLLRSRLHWPLRAHDELYSLRLCGTALGVLVASVLAANIVSPGEAGPLPYVPLFNPLELASVFALLVAAYWWRSVPRAQALLPPQAAAFGAAGAGLFLLTMGVARAVHHWGGVPFDLERLAESAVLQAALSIVWGSAALAGMLAGARTARREVWLAGAALMGAVVLKLFLVELDNAGTVGRVVSFLGVGLLLLVVGYFAPVPPRRTLEARNV